MNNDIYSIGRRLKFFLTPNDGRYAAFLASYLELVPTACIGGILLYVASGMVKKREVQEVMRMNKFHIGLMIYTAAMVPAFGFMTAVVSAIVIYAIAYCFMTRKEKKLEEEHTIKEIEDEVAA